MKMKKILKGIGIALLLVAMAYASNWDLPKETRATWKIDHAEELEQYEIIKASGVQVDGVMYYGRFDEDGNWHEPAEIYQEVVDYYLRGGENGQ